MQPYNELFVYSVLLTVLLKLFHKSEYFLSVTLLKTDQNISYLPLPVTTLSNIYDFVLFLFYFDFLFI